MAYSKQTWTNGVSKLNATRMQHIEDGLEAAATVADAAIPKTISGVATDKVPVYNGSSWVAQKLVNAQIDAAAAIAYSKLNLTGGIVNADIASAAAIAVSKLSGSYTSYSPTWTADTTNPVIGNGAIVGKYLQIGKLVIGYIEIAVGSSTTLGSGAYSFTLPVTSPNANFQILGAAEATDASPFNIYAMLVRKNTTTTVQLASLAAPTVQGSPTVPFTWASGDFLSISFTYEAA